MEISNTLVEALYVAAQAESDKKQSTEILKAARAQVGFFFEGLCIAYRSAPKAPPRNKREQFSIPELEAGLSEAEATIKVQGAAAHRDFTLPKCWTQYASDIKRAIGSGLAAELYTGAEPARVGIFKLKSLMLDRGKDEKAAGDPWYALMRELSETVAKLRESLADDADADATRQTKLRTVRAQATASIEAFIKYSKAQLTALDGKAEAAPKQTPDVSQGATETPKAASRTSRQKRAA